MVRHGLAAAFALAASAAAAQDGPPERVFVNGKVATVDDDFSIAEAFAVDDGRFTAVGSNDEIRMLAGEGTEVVDLGGRTVIPGLIDSHLHQFSAAMNIPRVPLIDARNMDDVRAAIAERVATTPPGEWVMASSAWHESILEEGRLPTRADLDPVSPDNPVFIPRGGHVITVNSKALELAGITKDTPDPEHGVIVRDESGEPTGVLLEDATHLVEDILPPPPPPEEQIALLKEMMAELNSLGVVAVTEPGLNDQQIETYRQLEAEDELTTRTHMLYRVRSDEQVQHVAETYERDAACDDMLCFTGVKIGLDGGVEGARLYEPYQVVPGEQPDPEYRGVMILPEGGVEGYRQMLKRAAETGFQVQTHGVGDETLDVIVNSYAEIDETMPVEVGLDGLRWTVQHVFLPTPEAIETMKEEDILVTLQNHPVLLGHNQLRWWGQPRAGYAIPVKDLVEAGLVAGGGTDAPVVPPDPYLSIWWMTTRGTLGGEPLGPEQAVSVEDALRMWTIDSATTQFAEDVRGSIEEGKLADFAVLSDDILIIPPEEIRNLSAILTSVGGRIVHGSIDDL